MKNILLATDLSISSAGVSTYAAWLAGVMGARLTVMSAYRAVPVFAGSGSISESSADRLADLVNCRLEEMATRLGAEHRIGVDVLARTGDPVRAILATARDIGADLVVVGKTGAGHAAHPEGVKPEASRTGLSAATSFGATVARLARKTPIPLLIVPEGTLCVLPKAIAVSKESFAGEVSVAISKLLRSFSCRLFLFGVRTKKTDEIVEIYRAEAIHSTGEPFHLLYEIPVDRKLRHSLENFIESAPIHWLAACPLPGLTPERWVLRGRDKELIFDIRVPLLITPEGEKVPGRRAGGSF